MLDNFVPDYLIERVEVNKQFASAVRPGTTITAYLTPDSFDKVVAFCRSIAKEYASPRCPRATCCQMVGTSKRHL